METEAKAEEVLRGAITLAKTLAANLANSEEAGALGAELIELLQFLAAVLSREPNSTD